MAAALLRKSLGAQRFLSEKPAVLRRTIRTTVFWDIDDCKIPKGYDPLSIAGNITDALANLNYGGPVPFFAYGDMFLIDPKVRKALSDTGVKLIDTYTYDDHKYASSSRIYLDNWIFNYPAPGNYLIISGYGRLSRALQQVGRGYNILLAKPRKGSSAMEAKAKAIWRWRSLVAGGPPERINQ